MKINYDELKSGGFIKQTQENLFTVRLRCPGGKLQSQQLRKAAEIADKYGKGEVHTSVRQSIEIPYVHHKDFDAVVASLREINWSVASCGPRVRVPVACAGCTYNPNGLVDSQALCMEVDRQFFGTPTGHHKFKITFAGCPIDCPGARDADLGFQGTIEPELVNSLCNGCGLCVSGCDDKALTMVKEHPIKDSGKCTYCGDCIKVCPMDAMAVKKKGWLVRVGGKHGKHPIHSYEIVKFASEKDCFSIIEKTLEWYKVNGKGRERIGATIIRTGLKKYLEEAIKPLGLDTIETNEERRKFKAEGNFYT